MKRRDFIKASTGAAAGFVAAPYILRSVPNQKPVNELFNSNDNIFIIVELFGGNDGLNTIVPIAEEDTYRQLRDTLFIPADETARFEQSDLYMNRALVVDVHNGGMMRLLAEGNLAVVQGIGYENPTLSHFRSRDIWHAGLINSNPDVRLLEGWIGRYFAEALPDYPDVIPDHPLAIHVGGSIPLAFKSEKGHMGIALTDPDSFYELGAGLEPVDQPFQKPLEHYFQEEYNFTHNIASQSETYSKAVKAAYDNGIEKIKVDYSGGFAQQFKLISALIAGGLNTKVYHVRLSNFDSHAQQMDANYQGAHATLLKEVANGISEFLDDAKKQGYNERVAGMTVSEFGRRASDNGSRGTDHGAASIQFVFSGSDENINGGFFNNDGQPVFANLNSDNNIDYTYDFRRTYADALELWLGATPEMTEAVFGESVPRLEVLRKRSTSVSDDISTVSGKAVKIYPNPSRGRGIIEFTLKRNRRLTVAIYEVTGKKVLDVKSGFMLRGNHRFDFVLRKSGNYMVVINTGENTFSEKLTVLK